MHARAHTRPPAHTYTPRTPARPHAPLHQRTSTLIHAPIHAALKSSRRCRRGVPCFVVTNGHAKISDGLLIARGHGETVFGQDNKTKHNCPSHRNPFNKINVLFCFICYLLTAINWARSLESVRKKFFGNSLSPLLRTRSFGARFKVQACPVTPESRTVV